MAYFFSSRYNATFSPPQLENGQIDITDVAITGVKLSQDNSISCLTDLSAYPNCFVYFFVVADNKVRVKIENQTGATLALPALNIRVIEH